jgi:poly-gamma-glutamate synthesis protein (capsule biosynthesis protein)
LVAALEAHPLAFAIVPIDLIDFRVQALAIDGNDPLAGRGDLSTYPLKQDFWLNWDTSLGSGLRTAVNAFAMAQGFWTDLATPPGNPINVTVAGDIIFGRTVHTRMLRYGDFAHPMRLVAPRLSNADLTIADLECSMSDRTEKPDDPFTFLFTTDAAAVEGLVLAGLDGVSLANNHSMNFGQIGLEDTIATLQAHGIKAFGGGMNLSEARKPGIFEVKGVKFFFLGYDGITAEDYGAGPTWAGTCPLDMKLVLEDIAAAKAAGADLIIPFFHWSEEYVAVPSVTMRRIAHQAIDAGAAMVLGSHPHWVQGTEWYKGKAILYSLGNFVFDQDWSIETKQGMFTEIVVRDKRVARVRLVPVLIEDYNRPRILDVVEGLPVLQRVYDATDVISERGAV